MSECGNNVGGIFTSTTTILVLYILLVIILKTF
ncbi:MAG: YjcZ family sporulation protein [Paenibacillus sp.]|nr:YjcZ family sporulation protein [Paenibacillus sp.]